MFQLCQAIYTGYPVTKCKVPRNPLVNINLAHRLKHCVVQKNCLLYSYRNITVRITKSGCIKIHFSRNNIFKHNSKEKLKFLIEKIISNISVLFFNACLKSYQFSTNNIHFKGKLDISANSLFDFCLQTFTSASIYVGQIDNIIGSTITYVRIFNAPTTSIIYTKLKVQDCFFCITISRSSKYTGIAKSIETYNNLKHLLEKT